MIHLQKTSLRELHADAIFMMFRMNRHPEQVAEYFESLEIFGKVLLPKEFKTALYWSIVLDKFLIRRDMHRHLGEYNYIWSSPERFEQFRKRRMESLRAKRHLRPRRTVVL